MNTAQATAIDLITLPDEQYYTIDDAGLMDLQTRLVAALKSGDLPPPPGAVPVDANFLALSAPRTVVPERRDDLPFLLASRQTGRRQWEVEHDLNARVVLSDLRTGAVMSERIFVRPKRMLTPDPSMSGPEPGPIEAASLITGVRRRTGVAEIFNIEWRPTRYAVTVLSYDLASNTVPVEIRSEVRAPEPVEPGMPSPFLTSTAPAKYSPKLEGAGAAVALPSRVSEDAPIPVYAAVNLPASRVALTPSSAPEDGGAGGEGGRLLRATLFLLARDSEYPVQIDAAVPVTPREVGGERMVEAYFGFDALAAAPEPVPAGDYQVYLIVGEALAGPYPLTVAAR